MSVAEIVEQLKEMSEEDLRLIIEAANRLRWQVAPKGTVSASGDDPILRMAGALSGDPVESGEIDRTVYGPDRG